MSGKTPAMTTLPKPARLYQALVDRDPAFEGVFLVGVKTTGIFCRPACTARKPKPENCEFFPGPKEALFAGYRACKRCKPLDRSPDAPPAVLALRDLVDKHPDRRFTDETIQSLGLDPSTARRQFVKHCGMTFHAYQRARRMGLALRNLHDGSSVNSAMRRAGYASTSGFGAAFAGVFGATPSTADAVEPLLVDRFATPLGEMVAVANDEGLALLEFHDRRALERELDWLRRKHRAAFIPGRNPILRQTQAEITEYFRGERTRFTIPLLLQGSAFQLRAWNALLKIPSGQTKSYRELAEAIGSPTAIRAVGRANGDNRLAIVIPCHRVIRSDGSTCGYGGGVWRKVRLLELEATGAVSAVS